MSDPISPVENWTSKDIYALIFAMVIPTIVTLVYFQWLETSESSFQQIAFAIGKGFQFGFPVAWIWLFHRSKLRRSSNSVSSESSVASDGHKKVTVKHAVLIGIGFGMMVVVAMFAIYFLLLAETQVGEKLVVLVKAKVLDMGVDSRWKYIGLGIFYALCHSFLEEYYWRWFVFDVLQKFVSWRVAIVVSSLGFMAHHVVLLGFYFDWQWMTYPISFCIALGGMFWAWQFEETGKLRASWMSHMIVDAGIFALGFFLIQEIL